LTDREVEALRAACRDCWRTKHDELSRAPEKRRVDDGQEKALGVPKAKARPSFGGLGQASRGAQGLDGEHFALFGKAPLWKARLVLMHGLEGGSRVAPVERGPGRLDDGTLGRKVRVGQ
jgi:hypothetical protein